MGTPNHYGGAEWLRRASKRPKIVTSTFFNTVHLLQKDLSFEHGGASAKLASCPGCHLTSLRPCTHVSSWGTFLKTMTIYLLVERIVSRIVFLCTVFLLKIWKASQHCWAFPQLLSTWRSVNIFQSRNRALSESQVLGENGKSLPFSENIA